MSGQAEISVLEKYVLINVTGDPLLPDEIASTLMEAAAKAVQLKSSILIFRDMPVRQQASTIDFYHYAESLRSSPFRGKLALAFPKEMHTDNLDFFETAAINRGINVKIFSTKEEAHKWISSDS